MTSRGSLTMALCASTRQQIIAHSDAIPIGQRAETLAALGPIRTEK